MANPCTQEGALSKDRTGVIIKHSWMLCSQAPVTITLGDFPARSTPLCYAFLAGTNLVSQKYIQNANLIHREFCRETSKLLSPKFYFTFPLNRLWRFQIQDGPKKFSPKVTLLMTSSKSDETLYKKLAKYLTLDFISHSH